MMTACCLLIIKKKGYHDVKILIKVHGGAVLNGKKEALDFLNKTLHSEIEFMLTRFREYGFDIEKVKGKMETICDIADIHKNIENIKNDNFTVSIVTDIGEHFDCPHDALSHLKNRCDLLVSELSDLVMDTSAKAIGRGLNKNLGLIKNIAKVCEEVDELQTLINNLK